jgi:hypothetical protein
MRKLLEHMEGQLTVTLQMDDADLADARMLLPVLERKAGRVLVNGFPTGVEVAHAMVHGGPFPATSDGRSTSVGTLAIQRFLRPVCYQDFPAALLPEALQDGNPLHIPRRLDGKLVGVAPECPMPGRPQASAEPSGSSAISATTIHAHQAGSLRNVIQDRVRRFPFIFSSAMRLATFRMP